MRYMTNIEKNNDHDGRECAPLTDLGGVESWVNFESGITETFVGVDVVCDEHGRYHMPIVRAYVSMDIHMTPEMEQLMGFEPELNDLEIDLSSPYRKAAEVATATAVLLSAWLSVGYIGWFIWRIFSK